nr:immunoglobulin light chain junction region [Macaca mulatta]
DYYCCSLGSGSTFLF